MWTQPSGPLCLWQCFLNQWHSKSKQTLDLIYISKLRNQWLYLHYLSILLCLHMFCIRYYDIMVQTSILEKYCKEINAKASKAMQYGSWSKWAWNPPFLLRISKKKLYFIDDVMYHEKVSIFLWWSWFLFVQSSPSQSFGNAASLAAKMMMVLMRICIYTMMIHDTWYIWGYKYTLWWSECMCACVLRKMTTSTNSIKTRFDMCSI